MNQLNVEFAYEWRAILVDASREYLFPEKITSFMKSRYKHPAIYRWDIFSREPEDKKLIYVGECQQLCPQRINSYLNPGPSQQTNKRINEEFQDYLKNGFRIRLDVLGFDVIKIEDFFLTNSDLIDKHVRRFIEEVMIIIYRRKGFTILNL